MPSKAADSSSCAKVMPPWSLMAFNPLVPSDAVPDSDETASMENFLKEASTVTAYPKIFSQITSDHNVSMGLDKIIEEAAIDMFALSTQKRTWFEKIYNPSLTQKISNHTYIPLLAFHNSMDEERTGKDF